MEIWIGRDGERHGPYKEEDVREWLHTGKMSGADLGWYEGLADWQPLSVLLPDAVAGAAPTGASATPPALTALPQTTAAALEDYAGFWQRLSAWVIDYLVLLVPMAFVAVSMGSMTAFEHLMTQLQSGSEPAVAMAEFGKAMRPASLIMLTLGYIYYVAFECSSLQATPGKLALRLRVTDVDGQRLSVGRSAARNAIRLVNVVTGLIPLVFYLPVAWTARKQGLHDMLAKTLVLNGRANQFKDAQPHDDGQPGTGSLSA